MAQDMPPPGGFANINVERTLAKPFLRQSIYLGILIGMTVNGLYVLREWKKRYRVLKIEQNEHFIAASPFMLAEQERKFLRDLRNGREEERELMKNVDGWTLGTYYGEPIFKTLPKNEIPPIAPFEYFAHRSEQEFLEMVHIPDIHQ